MLSVLFKTSPIVPHGAMREKEKQKDKVEIRQGAVKESGYGPAKGGQKFGNVVKMSRNSPPSRCQ